MRTTEYSDHTESKRVGGLVAYTRNMSPTDFLSVLFSVYLVYSVVHHLPFFKVVLGCSKNSVPSVFSVPPWS